MYISSFWVGVVTTILAEVAAMVLYVILHERRQGKR